MVEKAKKKRGRQGEGGGQRTKYTDKMPDKLIEYFDIEPTRTTKRIITTKKGDRIEEEVEVANDTPLIEGFCRQIKICTSTFDNWKAKYPRFMGAYKRAKDLQKYILVTNGISGRYPPGFACFAAKNMIGWRDKQEFEHSGNITVNVVKFGKGK